MPNQPCLYAPIICSQLVQCGGWPASLILRVFCVILLEMFALLSSPRHPRGAGLFTRPSGCSSSVHSLPPSSASLSHPSSCVGQALCQQLPLSERILSMSKHVKICLSLPVDFKLPGQTFVSFVFGLCMTWWPIECTERGLEL